MKNRNNISLMFLLVGTLTLSSCFIGRKYERPSVAVNNLFRMDALGNTSQDTNSMALVNWKEVFSDTILQHYIEQGLVNNFDIRIAIKSIDAAAAYVKQIQSAFGPVASATLNYGIAHNPKYTGLGNVNQFQLSADLSWEADIWGKIKNQKNATEAAYLQTVEAKNMVKTRLVANLANIYFQLIALDKQESIAQKSIQTRDSSLQTTKALMQAGQLTAVAIQQSQAQVYEAQNILLNLKNQRRVLENAFCFLLSEPPSAIRRSSFEKQHINTPLAVGVPAQLLENRPDVKQAEYALRQALSLTNVAEANFYPSLVLTASTGFKAVDIKDWLTPEGIFAQVAGGVLQPIINRRQLKTQLEVAQTKEEQAYLRYQQILLAAGNDVSNALFDFQTQSEALDLQEKQNKVLQTAVKYSQQLLVNGLASYLEVLSAQQNVLSTELALANTHYKRWAAMIQLYQSLGGGWR
ncbi:MAG TPA: efflux transporter outer membrane subunit [Edaphocola sp.]|nr:efflux transporter outer membrane subunit [Edaphocola sp.]